MASARTKWKCLDCGTDTKYEHYFIHNHVWYQCHNSNKGMLCISCLEKRLGRKLNKTDFTDCYINRITYGKKSTLLIERLTH